MRTGIENIESFVHCHLDDSTCRVDAGVEDPRAFGVPASVKQKSALSRVPCRCKSRLIEAPTDELS